MSLKDVVVEGAVWWEKTVEYIFFGKYGLGLSPLDGDAERDFADVVVSLEGCKYLLIEFKKNKECFSSEYKKFNSIKAYGAASSEYRKSLKEIKGAYGKGAKSYVGGKEKWKESEKAKKLIKSGRECKKRIEKEKNKLGLSGDTSKKMIADLYENYIKDEQKNINDECHLFVYGSIENENEIVRLRLRKVQYFTRTDDALLGDLESLKGGIDIDAFNEYAKKLCIVKASKAFPVDGNKSIEDEDKDILSQQSVVGVKKNGDLFILNLCQFSELCKQISEYKLNNSISDALKKKTGEANNTSSNPKKNKKKYN